MYRLMSWCESVLIFHASYFRNALVRANDTNQDKKISSTDHFLVKFYENLLNHADHLLLDGEENL